MSEETKPLGGNPGESDSQPVSPSPSAIPPAISAPPESPAAPPPERERPAAPTPRPSTITPGFYELDPTIPGNVLDSSGRIDWRKAMGEDWPAPSRPAVPSRPSTAGARQEGYSVSLDRPTPQPTRPTPQPTRPTPIPVRPTPPPVRPTPQPTRPTHPPAVVTTEALEAGEYGVMPGADKVLKPRAGTVRPSPPTSPGVIERTATPRPIAPQSESPTPSGESSGEPPSRPFVPKASGTVLTGAPGDEKSRSEPPARPSTAVRMSRYEQLKREPSFKMNPEAIKMANEFSEILFHINRALEKLGDFRQKYPFMIAPNVFGSWEGNLKESTTTMLREFQNMREVKTKTYDRRFVCRMCKSVFFVSLPDGICDECRGQMAPNAYDNLNFKDTDSE